MILLIAAQLAAAQTPLSLSLDAPLISGDTVTFSIEGLDAGEQGWLIVGDIGSTCPPYLSTCIDVVNPHIVTSLQGTGLPIDVPWTVPTVIHQDRIQVVTMDRLSNIIDFNFVIIQGPPQLSVVSFATFCNDPTDVDIIVEYVGSADEGEVSAYLNGAIVSTHTLAFSAPGKVFSFAESIGQVVSDCSDLSWVVEMSSVIENVCRVKGNEATDLINNGLVPPYCEIY